MLSNLPEAELIYGRHLQRADLSEVVDIPMILYDVQTRLDEIILS
jgi:hypothetical protein